MSSPQLENGYVRIANEILEALYLSNLTALEFRCVLFIIRKTYGFNKKKDQISLSQFSEALNIPTSNVARLLRQLLAKGTITRDTITDDRYYHPRYYQIDKKVLSRVIDTKDNTKDNIYKHKKNMDNFYEEPAVYVDGDGDQVEAPSKPKRRSKPKAGLHVRIAAYYCKVMGKRSAVQQYPAAKEIVEIARNDFPGDTDDEILKEVKGRIDVAFRHYDRIGCTWGLGKVAENWDIILKDWHKENQKYE